MDRRCAGAARSDAVGVIQGPALRFSRQSSVWIGLHFDMAYGCNQPKVTIDDPVGTAQMEWFTANQASIVVRTPAGGTLTYRDAWTPDWHATVDGVAAPLRRNRDGFKLLSVPPGTHRVDLAFRPFVGERIMLALAIMLTMSLVIQVWLAFWGVPNRPELAA